MGRSRHGQWELYDGRPSRTVLRGTLGETPEVYSLCDVNEGLKERFFGATEEDEGRALGVGRQRQASNQAVRLELKRPRS